jgi:hypothetical protein
MQCDTGTIRVSESALLIDQGCPLQRRLGPTPSGTHHRAGSHLQPKKAQVAQIHLIRNSQNRKLHRAWPPELPRSLTLRLSSGRRDPQSVLKTMVIIGKQRVMPINRIAKQSAKQTFSQVSRSLVPESRP